MSAAGAPGQVFKLPEDDVRARLEWLSRQEEFGISYRPSAIQGLVTRDTLLSVGADLIYKNRIKAHG
jgi:hypothetical protein